MITVPAGWPALLGGAWAAAVVAGAGRHRPRRCPPVERLAPATPRSERTPRRDGPPMHERLAAATPRSDRTQRRDRPPMLERLGQAVVVRAGRAPVDPPTARRVGAAVLAAAVAAALWPAAAFVVAPAVAAVAWAAPGLRARGRERRRAAEIEASLPEAVDLFNVAVAAGLTVPLAIAAVSRRACGPVGRELAVAVEEAALGRRLSDALDDVVVRAGEPVRPLVAALTDADRYGAPLGAGLERLGHEVRLVRRRRAEEAARRVPVKLLFPLVLCSLPAFALLTVVPVVASALRALRP